MNRKIFKIILFSMAAMVLVSAMVLNNQQKNSTKTHFDKWELDYPETKEIMEYKSKRLFGNDFSDSIVFPFDEKLEKEIKQYLNDHKAMITSVGDEGDELYNPSTLKIFHDFSDHAILKKKIDSYGDYKYWVIEKNNGFDKLGILTSESEVIFVFIKL